ncbi:type III-B CRISPR module-associated protein Cmr5 [Phocoenobacter skyensis]|uniref:CRISPR type III-B/RAMP module-associated protein Cmr5 n=1 Tax=Phocoenobacter skyensis TaxID=97481 RepID=A0A1H7WVZ6_9PAST|nr:type III-B CRISPR module-associated protein Cmr5 [Pasteurella skyensis]MDP8079322.1 type III-B CRISPR module-associated protein Cmr5 [Pasteurella skyensis]MDP8085457.1 type III-B CRISPR module-associated protein Cmr5 [Pasteurella skyensis]MDP8170529.1 type III-B CRISPR module-associated protein Cmr5 [Pasteurella skyensis]MDP8174509.1 type III-B CRISPR module-associated protein Cmr5 [Pasteurella skyensis]MDP8185188.1 type III-B CRISPR module-associated protein Cmr5 [Pasteurella skyensis]
MPIQTIEQERAKYALEKVQAVNPRDFDEWKARANEMPAMIQMNGLGQTVAFYLSKGGVHKQMYEILSDWLCKEKTNPNVEWKYANIEIYEKKLIDGITQGDMKTYRVAQAEAQALLIWVKKFSKAYC